MPRTVEKTVYKFSELSDTAKERARDWYREGGLSYDWWDSVYDDANECAKLIGIEIGQKPVTLMGGGTRYDPCIWFNGFSSQGDGACFEGRYAYAKGGAKAIRDHAPKDKTLHAIADNLRAIQRKYFYKLEARVKHSGHYYHEFCTDIDVFREDDSAYADEPADADAVRTELRAFMKWIYRQLEADHDYLTSDEAVDESIEANEYEFTEAGRRAC